MLIDSVFQKKCTLPGWAIELQLECGEARCICLWVGPWGVVGALWKMGWYLVVWSSSGKPRAIPLACRLCFWLCWVG